MLFNENGEMMPKFNLIHESTQNTPDIENATAIWRILSYYLHPDFEKLVVICGDTEDNSDFEVEIYNKRKGKVACMILPTEKETIIECFDDARLYFYQMNLKYSSVKKKEDAMPNNIAFIYINSKNGVIYNLKIDYNKSYKAFHDEILKELQKK